MNTGMALLNSLPYPIAKLYESMGLEDDPRQRVRCQVELFERTCQYLVLIGLAIYNQAKLHAPEVATARAELGRPSLGHWVATLKALSRALREELPGFLTKDPAKVYADDGLSRAVESLLGILGEQPPKRIRLHHMLDTMVQFRNARIGHGVLSHAEAAQIMGDLDEGLVQWLAEIPVLTGYALLSVEEVNFMGGQFVYRGTRLDAGTSLLALTLRRDAAAEPQRVYLHEGASGALHDLYPYFYYDAHSRMLYDCFGLTGDGFLSLRCPYDAPGAESEVIHKVDRSFLVGAGVSQPETAEQPKEESEPKYHPKTQEVAAMTSWFKIIPPHDDIRQGGFDESVFAADLGDVAAGTASEDYRDAYTFFKKTYQTAGLRSLLQRVHDKLSDGKGSSVVEIQTPFGGGKTHALVAIYHYAVHGEAVRELLPPGAEPIKPKVCVVSGNHWNILEGNETDGVRRYTFWGELAYQIGGSSGYAEFAEDDRQRVSPGKDKLMRFLERHQPFVLLFDEILEYVNRAVARRDDADVSLATQTFSFFQELTEAVAGPSRGLLVVTLPSSQLEDFGDREEESLARMNKIFGRVESIETPVQGQEVYAVIRRRLFDVEQMQTAEMREVVHRYFTAYQQHKDELPSKSREVSFREKMELAYPFHPDVIDILYEKWSTFSSFQRTRGVLRLLANVVEDLYQRESNIDMILPGDINLDRPSVRQEFLRHAGYEYEGIIGSDVAGHEAKAQSLDAANRSWEHLAQRIATAVFFHSFSADRTAPGINLPYIKLAVVRPDTIPSMVTEILQRLENTLWYMNKRGDAFYFSRIPNLNRMILDKKELYNESYRPRMKQVIEHEVGNAFSTYVWPDREQTISDNRSLKLLILQPDDNGAHISTWVERHGQTFRQYKNTLFFAVADPSGSARLRDDIKTLMALEEIEQQVTAGESQLPTEKLDEVRQRKRAIEREFSDRVRRMYHSLRVGAQEIDLGQPVAGAEAVGHWFMRELSSGERGVIVPQLHYRVLVNKFMTDKEQIASRVILDQFYMDPALPVPTQESVVARAIQLGVQESALGLADLSNGSVSRDSLRFGRQVRLDDVTFGEGEVLLSKGLCETLLAQWADEDRAMTELEPGTQTTTTPGADSSSTGAGITGTTGGKGQTSRDNGLVQPEKHHRLRLVVSNMQASKIADINRGIFMPLAQLVDGGLTFTLTIDVSSTEGIGRDLLDSKIKETIRQIGAQIVEEDAQ